MRTLAACADTPKNGTLARQSVPGQPHLFEVSSLQGVGISSIAVPHHSGLRPANFTTLPHFSVSSARSLLKSAGEPASGVPPKSANRAFIIGSTKAALISLLSFSTISTGVFLGTP